jgi:DNA-binding NtrC family response regulator
MTTGCAPRDSVSIPASLWGHSWPALRAIRCTGYRSSRTLLERLEQGDVDVLVLGGRLEDMDSIQFLPRIRGLARKPLVLLRDDGRNEKSAVESLSQEDACYLIRQATLQRKNMEKERWWQMALDFVRHRLWI